MFWTRRKVMGRSYGVDWAEFLPHFKYLKKNSQGVQVWYHINFH